MNTIKTLILALTLSVIASNAAIAQTSADSTTVTAASVSVDSATATTGPTVPVTNTDGVRVVQRIVDENAANSDNYCEYQQMQFCNYYGCFYRWQYICYPW